MTNIKTVTTDQEIEECSDVMLGLRTHLKKTNFLKIIKDMQKEGNYFHLDSGTHRGQAHKFYFKQGLSIA